MNTKRIPGFQWAMMIFIFFIIAYAAPIILKDFQGTISLKTFVFDISSLAPFIAAIICLLVFKHRGTQLGSLKFSISLKVIERIILALVIPLIIFIIAMICFNVYADSFVLLQTEDLSVSIISIIIGQIIMAFLVEFGFRSYLQHIVETKMNTFIASIIVGIMYSIWNVNISFSFDYAIYSFLYSFAFSMIIGELIRATKGRTIYIATIFHATMSFGLVFLFNEELGDVFPMKVIALSTVAVAAVYILLSIIVRAILYFFTKRNLDEVDDNNYLDHVNETSENDAQIDDDVDEDSVQDENKTNTSTSDSSKSTPVASGVAVANRTTHDSDQQPHTDDTTKTTASTVDDKDTTSPVNEATEQNNTDFTTDVNQKKTNTENNTMYHNSDEINEQDDNTKSNDNDNNDSNNLTNSSVEASTEANTTHATHNDATVDNDSNDKHTRSPFNLKSKRGHRR
ncbi:lysostaphin resistance protein A [Staphylococcus equorum subsp. linens]|uniref:CPBP family intramembrane glutamic endopeptidase n=1 Tax=Staphylococcus equorum TaxID=246432 RepID=UPI000CCFE3FE|nr:CPBP family intramembrane glutamic endopeptidase [Staphylococcus equorum]MDK9844141.1 lysostaphin resistance A-like protein [Staphylococcus equorum]PNZ09384.1 lysostaphin resistance protein A [Staphylococcus equorum subsp. linens]QQT17999.1 CPBP family intramembrane metalloprotease [Staphylococcus equorum]